MAINQIVFIIQIFRVPHRMPNVHQRLARQFQKRFSMSDLDFE